MVLIVDAGHASQVQSTRSFHTFDRMSYQQLRNVVSQILYFVQILYCSFDTHCVIQRFSTYGRLIFVRTCLFEVSGD